MHITCVICSDLITGSDDTFTTCCGHLFHYNCVMQWFERSKTCPQCRAKTSEKKIHRIYFNIANIEGADDPSSLQNTIESLKFKMKMKDVDIKNAKQEKNQQLLRNKALRNEVKSLEEQLGAVNSSLLAVREQLTQMKIENRKMNDLIEENKKLKDRVQTLYGLETIRSGSAADVDDLLGTLAGSSSESRSLATYCSALKRELQEMERKRKALHSRMKEFSHNLSGAYAERDMLKEKLKEKGKEVMQLTEELYLSNTERERLEKKLKESNGVIQNIQQSDGQSAAMTILNKLTGGSPSKESAATEILRLLAESPAPEELVTKLKRSAMIPTLSESKKENVAQKINFVDLVSPPQDAVSKRRRKVSAQAGPQLSDPTLEDDMPHRAKEIPSTSGSPRKSQRSGLLQKTSFSILQKPRSSTKPEESLRKVMDMEVFYDGLGGHKKQDYFPNPRAQTFTLGAKPKIKKSSNVPIKGTNSTIDNFLKGHP